MTATIDIVIPCAGRQADLLRLLDSLKRHAASSLRAHVASITVTDDRPSEQLRQALADRHADVRYVHGPSRGPAANRNHGARVGLSPWILFLDDDCFVADDLLAAYAARRAALPEANVVEGAIHPVGERPNGNHNAPLNITGEKLWSCNLLIERAAFEAVCGFDERFPFACMEDVDLADRLRSAGCRITFAASARVLHPWRSLSERELTRQLISHAIYADKHPRVARRWGFGIVARMVKGRLRQYVDLRSSTIPAAKYGAVAYDLMLPLALLAVMRVSWLRAYLSARYRNVHTHETAAPIV